MNPIHHFIIGLAAFLAAFTLVFFVTNWLVN